jgi:hypothetical protein
VIGEHVVTVAGTDLSCWVDELSIRHGRADTTTQPDPSSATVNLSWDAGESPLPDTVGIGAPIYVDTVVAGVARPRFRGRVTDMAVGWDDAGEDTPAAQQGQLSAVGTLSDLGRRIVGDAPFPVENDAQRVARVATLAGMPLDPFVSDPGTVQIRARDIDSQPALAVMRGVAVSASGIVWQSVAGDLRYTDNNHRRNVSVGLELDACDVLVTPTWSRNLDGLTNEVSVGYGVGEGGTQPRYTATNPTSQAQWGRYAYTTDTELAALADAQAMGSLLMRRNYDPVWMLAALPIAVEDLDADDTARLLTLDVSALVHLTGLPAIGNAPTAVYAWVEGWSETLSHGGHAFALVVSDFCRTSPSVRWDDPITYTWNTIPNAATRTWDQALCMGGPLPGNGRWDDTPSAMRWDQVAPAVTWDTWVQPPITERTD